MIVSLASICGREARWGWGGVEKDIFLINGVVSRGLGEWGTPGRKDKGRGCLDATLDDARGPFSDGSSSSSS